MEEVLLFSSLILTIASAGTLFLASGDKYTGDWKDGKRHGNGTYFYRYLFPSFFLLTSSPLATAINMTGSGEMMNATARGR
jgi:hypothetical protein